MRLTVTVVDPKIERSTDVVVDAEPEATAREVSAAITRLVRPGAPAAVLYVDGAALGPELPLSVSPLRDGTLVSLGNPAGCPPPEPDGLIEVRVVSGPDAGGVFRLDPGVVHVGSDPDAAVAVEDPSLPPGAVEVEVRADGTCTVTPRAELPTWLDGERLTGPAPWPVGGQLTAGWTAFELAVPAPPDAAVQPSEDGAGLDLSLIHISEPTRPY